VDDTSQQMHTCTDHGNGYCMRKKKFRMPTLSYWQII